MTTLDSAPAADSALDWSVTAMACALRRVGEASSADLPQAIAAATEAMWWVTGHSADPGDFIQHRPAPGAPGATWMWRPLPPPPPQRGRTRETSPYREYRTQLAGRPLAEALTRGAAFLSSTYAAATNARRKGTAVTREAPVPSGGVPVRPEPSRSPLHEARR